MNEIEHKKEHAKKLIFELNSIFSEIENDTYETTWAEFECLQGIVPIQRLIKRIDFENKRDLLKIIDDLYALKDKDNIIDGLKSFGFM